MGLFRCLCSILVLFVLTPNPAVAKNGNELVEATRKAQAYLDLATTLFKDKDYEGALAELERAEPLVQNTRILPLVRFNIARCYEELELPIEALGAYRRYLETGEAVTRRREHAHRVIKALRAAHVGRLVVSCVPAGAEVRLLGSDKKRDGCPADFGDILAREYSIEVSKGGHDTERRRTTVVPSQTTRIRFALARTKPLVVQSDNTSSPVDMVNETAESRTLFRRWFLGGAGIAVVAGAGVHFVAASQVPAIEGQPPGTARDEAVQSFEAQRVAALSLYALGGILVAAAIIYRPMEDDGDEMTLWVSPLSVGARVHF